MVKIFRNLVARTVPRSSRKVFWLYVLTKLVTTNDTKHAAVIVGDIAITCSSRFMNDDVKKAYRRLKALIGNAPKREEEEVRQAETPEEILTCPDSNLRKNSPYFKYFEDIISAAKTCDEGVEDNGLFAADLIAKLQRDYLPFFPLWSGVVVSQQGRNVVEGSERDSNAVVERYISTIKNEVLRKERNITPGKACRLLHVFHKGIAIEKTTKKVGTKGKKKKVSLDDTQHEVKWERPSLREKRKKKSKYFSTPKKGKFSTDTESGGETTNRSAQKVLPKNVSQKVPKSSKKLPKKTSGKCKAEKTALYDDHDVDEITAPFQFVDENAMPW